MVIRNIFEQRSYPAALLQNELPEKLGSANLEQIKLKGKTYKTQTHRLLKIIRWVDPDDLKKKPSISDDLILLLLDFKLPDNSSKKDQQTFSRFKGKLKRLAK